MSVSAVLAKMLYKPLNCIMRETQFLDVPIGRMEQYINDGWKTPRLHWSESSQTMIGFLRDPILDSNSSACKSATS
jgi:hypothetical protein